MLLLVIRRIFLFITRPFNRYFCSDQNIRNMDNASIKDNIRKIRKARKLTQEAIALQMGISLTAYRDLEKGDTAIVNGNLMKIAALLDTPPEEIVLGYRPSQTEGFNIQKLQEDYSGKIDTLLKRISDLEKLVSSQEETIRSKNEIISMLKKKLGMDE